MPIGDVVGGHEVVHQGDVLEVHKTPSGRFSIYDPRPGIEKYMKTNIMEYDDAVSYLEEFEGSAIGEEEEIALELAKRGQTGLLRMQQQAKQVIPYEVGETIPPGKPPALTYLGGGRKYRVWTSPKKRYTISVGLSGKKERDIYPSVSEADAQRYLAMLRTEDPEVAYQTISPELTEYREARIAPMIPMRPEERKMWEEEMKAARAEQKELRKARKKLEKFYGEY